MVQEACATEECSAQSAHPRNFRAAPAHNPRDQRGPSALPVSNAHFSRFGTSTMLASLPLCLLTSLRHSRSFEACHRSLAAQKLEILLTGLFSATSQFLIDKFLRISQTKVTENIFRQVCSPLACPEQSRSATCRLPSLSDSDARKLEITLSHRKRRIGKFLIDNFYALSRAFSRSFSAIPFPCNPRLSGCVPTPAFRRFASAAPCLP